MLEKLREQLHSYIVENNPDIIISQSAEGGYQAYLDSCINNVAQHIEKAILNGENTRELENECMNILTSPLRPSRYLYISKVLEEDFNSDFSQLRESGILTYEIINIMDSCSEEFETFEFSEETEEDRFLRYAIIAKISEYTNRNND